MAIEITERSISLSGKSSIDASTSIDLHYQLKGSDVLADLVAELDTEAPATYVDPVWGQTLVRADISWERIGYLLYNFTVQYVDPERYDQRRQLDVGEYRIRVRTAGRTERIYNSLSTVFSKAAPGKQAEDYNGALNVDRDHIPQGIDIPVPTFELDIEYRHPLASVTTAYVNLVRTLNGKVNDATFYGQPAGELRFLGADGSDGNQSDPQWVYHFTGERNIVNQTIGSIMGVSKKGQEYIWQTYDETPDPATGRMRIEQRAIYVEKLFEETDFSQLGIGTG